MLLFATLAYVSSKKFQPFHWTFGELNPDLMLTNR